MLEINKYFENNVIAGIKDKINNLSLEGCVNSFINYISDGIDNIDKNTFEWKYVSKLCDNYGDVFADVYMKKYENYSREELLKEVRTIYTDDLISMANDICNESPKNVLEYWPITDADAYDIIKSFMTKHLNEIVAEINKTAKETEIENLKKTRSNMLSNIENADKQLRIAERRLAELGVDVE